MFEQFIEMLNSSLNFVEWLIWTYFGFPMILILGIYFMWTSKAFQIFQLPKILKNFIKLTQSKPSKDSTEKGVHPLLAFFASIGGAIGVGNVIVVCLAVQIGGPGAIFWLWLTALIGMLFLYAEIYLGIKFRVPNESGSFDGGPMYYLQRVFKAPLWTKIIAFLMCLYGVEVLMFNIIVQTAVDNLGFNQNWTIFGLLILVLGVGMGGVDRVGKISGIFIPLFCFLYVGMCSYILAVYWYKIPEVLWLIVSTAFTGHAAVGGFLGSTVLVSMVQGFQRACYTGDIGIGYSSVLHAETQEVNPKKQASLAVIGIIIDTFIVCNLSLLVVLVTDIWKTDVSANYMVQEAFTILFPKSATYFMSLFVFLLAYTSLLSFYLFGLKAAKFLLPKWGTKIYFAYAVICFVVFSYTDTRTAAALMAVAGAFLLMFNLIGFYKLRHEIEFGAE